MQGGAGGLSNILGFMPFILIFFIFYFLIIRPQQKKQKEVENMINNLKKGDDIITTGGIIGTISSLKDDKIVLKIADSVKIELLKNCVVSKMEK